MPEEFAALTTGEGTLDHLLVESLTEYAIFVVSPEGLIRRWNRGAKALFGYHGDEVVGRNFGLLFTSEDVAAGAPAGELADALRGPVTGHDRWHVRKDGSRFWGMNTAQPLYDRDGTLLGFTKIVRDLTERYLASEALRESAHQLRILFEKTQHESLHDDLTGLANKQLFREYLDRAIARSGRHPESTFAVLFLDLDCFKAANDRLGHILADQLLVLVSHRLRQAVRAEDVLARFGGDEFAILIEDIERPENATSIAEHITRSFQTTFDVEGAMVSVTASIGIALASAVAPRRLTANQLLKDADFAMYEAKARGRARFTMFGDAILQR